MPAIYVHVYGAFYTRCVIVSKTEYLTCLLKVKGVLGSDWSKTESRITNEQFAHNNMTGVIWDFDCELEAPGITYSNLVTTINTSATQPRLVFTIHRSGLVESSEARNALTVVEILLGSLQANRWHELWRPLDGDLSGALLGFRVFLINCGWCDDKNAKGVKLLRERTDTESRKGPFAIPRKPAEVFHVNRNACCASVILAGAVVLGVYAITR
eukprot:gene22753-34850_t